MKKIVFIPFSSAEGNAVEQGKISQWITTRGGYRMACYTGAAVADIKDAGLFDQIYVLAHGSPGSDTVTGDANISLTSAELGDRLIASGLGKSYSGCIKIYACNSGTATDTNLSFAKNFARYIVKTKKRLLCRVYGYVGLLDSHYGTLQVKQSGNVTHKKPHKFSEVGGNEKRASKYRKRFYGLT